MSSLQVAAPAQSRAAAALGALLTVIVVGAAVGVVVAVRLVAGAGHTHPPPDPSQRFGIGDDVPTSFGFVAVEHAETLKGLSASQLGGATHGIGTFVGRDKAMVQAAITMTNTTGRPLRYDPRQFRLVAGRSGRSPRRIAAANANIAAGVLQPDAAIDARLSFVVPRDGSRMTLAFDDPGRPRPVVIDLRRGSGQVTAAEKKQLRSAHGAGHDHSG